MYQVKGFKSKPYRLKRLSEYAQRMSKDNTNVLFDDSVASVLQSQGYSCQESPRSIYKVDKLYEALGKFAPGRIPEPSPGPELDHGFALARASFSRPKSQPPLQVLPMTPETVKLIVSNPQASAGLTNYGCSKAESETRALERGLQVLSGEKAPEPCLAFKRTQFNDKTRLVWGYPFSMTLIEGLIAKPLNEQFKGGTTPMAYSIRTCALGTKLRTASYHFRWAYSIDMSSFDASIHSSLIRMAFRILKSWYDLDALEPVSGVSVGTIFNVVERYFIHTPIVMPNLRLYLGKEHGVPSGSYFTQIIDSIVNVIIAGTISYRFRMNVSRDAIFVLGDDLLIWSNRDIGLKSLASFGSKFFGVEFNFKKCDKFSYNDNIKYLGRIWEKGLPNLDEEAIIERMVYPERYRKYSKEYQDKRRQVRLLILSYAAVYRNAYSIARDTLWTDLFYKQSPGGMDLSVYLNPRGKYDEIDDDHLSGLERYLRKYVRSNSRHDMPHTAMQYWL